jgi:hypothetical protein
MGALLYNELHRTFVMPDAVAFRSRDGIREAKP